MVGTASFFCFVCSSLPVVPANLLAKDLTVQSRATGPLPPLRPTFSSLYGSSQLSITAECSLLPLKTRRGIKNIYVYILCRINPSKDREKYNQYQKVKRYGRSATPPHPVSLLLPPNVVVCPGKKIKINKYIYIIPPGAALWFVSAGLWWGSVWASGLRDGGRPGTSPGLRGAYSGGSE